MRQVTACGEVETHEGIAGPHQCKENGLVRLCAGMRLNIRERTVEESTGALDREFFRDIDIFAAAIVTTARISFCIFVGQDRSLGIEDGLGDDIFRGDEFDLVPLAVLFLVDGARHFGVCLR
jgi:hypothetical protein